MKVLTITAKVDVLVLETQARLGGFDQLQNVLGVVVRRQQGLHLDDATNTQRRKELAAFAECLRQLDRLGTKRSGAANSAGSSACAAHSSKSRRMYCS